MKKTASILLIFMISLYSCGEELETCEYNLEQTQIQLESLIKKHNQLVDDYNELYGACETLESTVSNSKSQINDIIRKLDWKSYDDKDDIISDLEQISVMNY